MKAEAHILKNNTILVALSKLEDENLVNDFCGSVIVVSDLSSELPNFSKKTVYLCGDISMANGLALDTCERVFVIRELSHGFHDTGVSWPIVDLGLVPIQVHGVGVYYRRFFDPNLGYFERICREHTFQSLTESTKPEKALRSGIYLTPVERNSEGLHFRLLRCSTNLSGPTENFRETDRHIVNALNKEASCLFENYAPLNHVLAQIYRNTPATDEQKQTKAKISSHADKTKDMPTNGIMAFCTFYDQLEKLQRLPDDPFDYGYKGNSGLTKLQFRLKNPSEEPGSLPTEFTLTLYPGSVFFMPLSTNRLYTHAIKASMLNATQIPTRLGYVVRCSSTEAVHKDGQTFLKKQGELKKLDPPTPEGMAQLRKLYAEENKTEAFINYGDNFLFSMNNGDYSAPEYKPEDEFGRYNVPISGNLFEELQSSVRLENVGKGRQGTVLVRKDETRGIPIVRTTTKYNAPAHCFRPVHLQLAKQIQTCASLSGCFNNALFEIYSNAYATMGFHSDQAQDLADESHIALFSCYQYPELGNFRKLVVESKEPDGGKFEIPLIHNSVVVFSLDTNRRFRHKIVLDTSGRPPENQWLGITFRTSKTFVRITKEGTFFEEGIPLSPASEEERRAFYLLRRRENTETNFFYPRATYTLSESDLMPPVS